MYAIIRAGGHQVRVAPGEVVTIDRLAGEPGGAVTFEEVLLVETEAGEVLAGAPFVANAKVVGVIADQDKGPKIRVFKKKRRKQYKRSRGHRSLLTRVRVQEIVI